VMSVVCPAAGPRARAFWSCQVVPVNKSVLVNEGSTGDDLQLARNNVAAKQKKYANGVFISGQGAGLGNIKSEIFRAI